MEDTGTIPVGATIHSVTIRVRARRSAGTMDIGSFVFVYFYPSGFISVPGVGDTMLTTSYTIFSTDALTTRPFTGAPWTRADLFATGGPANLMSQENSWELYFGNEVPVLPFCDLIQMVVEYSPPPVTALWCYNPVSNTYLYAAECPGPPWVASDPPTPTITGVEPRFSRASAMPTSWS
jgi:hypothetical protein